MLGLPQKPPTNEFGLLRNLRGSPGDLSVKIWGRLGLLLHATTKLVGVPHSITYFNWTPMSKCYVV